MSGELFRTNIVAGDPRYLPIIGICNWSLAGLFLGMLVTLSGVMLTAVTEQDKTASESGESQHVLAHLVGLTLLISGCLLIIFAVATFLVASLMYLNTTTTPPLTNGAGEELESVWTYLDNQQNKTHTSRNSK